MGSLLLDCVCNAGYFWSCDEKMHLILWRIQGQYYDYGMGDTPSAVNKNYFN